MITPNVTTPTPTVDPFYEGFSLQVQMTILSIALALGLMGNGFICLTFARNKSMRSLPNYIIVNLAVTDIILLLDMIIWMGLIMSSHLVTRTVYNFLISVDVMCLAASMLSVWLVSVERYMAVVRPLSYPSVMSWRRVKIYIASIWIFAIALGGVSFGRNFVKNMMYNTAFMGFLAAVTYFIPAVTIVFAYVLVFVTARKQLRLITIHTIHTRVQTDSTLSKRETWLAINILMIVLPFILFYGVYFGVTLCEVFYEECYFKIPAKASFFIGYSPHIVAAIDPIIYVLATRDYRVALKSFYTCKEPPTQVTGNETTLTSVTALHSELMMDGLPRSDARKGAPSADPKFNDICTVDDEQ